MAIEVERHGDVGVVTMTDAETMNSFDGATLATLRAAFHELMADDSVRAMVLTGSGRAFSAGADVGQFKRGLEEHTVTDFILRATEQLHPLMVELHRHHKPFVAAVNGVAAGGGLGLALAADVRVGNDKARFAAGYFGIGASPDGGSTWFLPRLIGDQRSRRFFFENQVLDAATAHEYGLLDEIVEADQLLARAIEVASKWGYWAEHSRGSTKRLLDSQSYNDLETQLDLERGLIAAAGATEDFRRGVTAFLAKERPDFA